MANRTYDKFVNRQLTGNAVNFSTDTFKVVAVSSGYTPNTGSAGDTFLSDIPSAARLSTTGAVTVSVSNRDVVLSGIALPDPGSGVATYLVFYKDTGAEATSPLIFLIDTASNLPITFDGTNDTINFDAQGLFGL